MEWNCCWSVNTVNPFLCESTGDSEDVLFDVNHDREEDEVVMADESEGISFRFDDEDEVIDDDDDDAQSCSYDHSSYINTRYGNNQHDQSQSIIYDDHEDGDIDDGDIDVDDDKNKNWGENMLLDSSKKQKISHKLGAESSNQKEIDRKFWEACLAN